MNPHALISELADAGVSVYLDGDRLKYRAPRGAMTDARRAQVASHRDELMAVLASHPAHSPPPVSQQVSLRQSTERLAPFLARLRAETDGFYCTGLPWPADGCLIEAPLAHWNKHQGRLPGELAGVLHALAQAWASGNRLDVDGWPPVPVGYQWEYSRLVAWLEADPTALSAQLDAWSEGITAWPNPLFHLNAEVAPPGIGNLPLGRSP